jgi:PAS domain S-box-containing protein
MKPKPTPAFTDSKEISAHNLNRMRMLTDGLDEQVYVIDPETYKILFANKKVKDAFRKTPTGRKCYEVFHNQTKPCPSCLNRQVLASNLSKALVREIQSSTNKRWYRCFGKTIIWANGKRVRYGIAVDITELKKMQESLKQSEELFRSVVENSHEGTLILDSNFRIVYANAQALRIGKYRRTEVFGHDFREFLDKGCKKLAEERYFRRKTMKKIPSRSQLIIVTKKGERRDIEVKSTAIKDKTGEVRVVVQIVDVTDRKKMEEALRYSEAKFRRLFEKVPAGVYQSTPEGKILNANPALVKMLGYSSLEELQTLKIGRDIYAKPADRKRWMQKINKDDCTHNAELVLRKKNGEKVVTLENSHTVRNSDGKVLYYEGTLIDITERKTLEERVSALNTYSQSLNSAKTLQQIYKLTMDATEKTLGFEHASVMIVEGRYLTLVATRGYPSKLSLRLPLDSEKGITVKAANSRSAVMVHDVKRVKTYIEGVPRMRSELAVPIKTEDRVLGVLNVESKRPKAFKEDDKKLLEILASHAATAISDIERLREIEKRSSQLASLMKSSAEMIRCTDLRKRLKTIAEAVSDLGWRRVVISLRDENLNTIDLVTAGLTHKEEQYLREHQSPGHIWRERLGSMFERFKLGDVYYLPWSDPTVREQFKYALLSKVSQEEMVDWNPDDLLFVPLRLPNGQIVGMMSMDDPVDGRRPTKESLAPLELFAHQAAEAIENAQLFEQLDQAKKQIGEYADHLEEKVRERTQDLRESEEKLRSIFAASPDAITVTDLDGNVVECNTQMLRLHGFSSKSDVIGKNVFDLLGNGGHQTALDDVMKTLAAGGCCKNIECVLFRKDGHEFPAELSVSAIRDSSGSPVAYVSITKDITERKMLQQQLIKSERLATIGEVAGMVGHDLRNPLTGIAGAAYYLKKKLGPDTESKMIEMLDLIANDIHYSNKIINDLLDYSRETKLDLTETNPKTMVAKTIAIVSIPDKVKIVDLTEDTPRVWMDVEKMNRTFANIIKNAVDAMPKGGKLEIRSRELDGSIEFIFSDTGVGMTKETLEKLWTPLFTTKARGMGFGLAICKRFVEAHDGSIQVESSPKKGTVFTVTIPIEPQTKMGGERIWIAPLESSSLTMTRT